MSGPDQLREYVRRLAGVLNAVRRRVGPRLPDLDLMMASANDPDEMAFLMDLVKRSEDRPGPIIEIGTLFGRTTIEMALAKSPEQKIITVDNYQWNPWGLTPQRHREFTAHALRFLTATGQVESVAMDKDDFYRSYDGPAPALVFLDAIHTYEETKKDIAWAKSAGAAIIPGHDHSDTFPGVRVAADEFGGADEFRGTLFVLADQT